MVYSITDRDSFDSIGAYHQQILRVKDTESVPIVLVGNKCDLEDGRCVAKNGTSTHLSLPAACITFPTSAARVMWNVVEGRYICEELGCRFVETSAKLGLNVEETFLNVVRRIRDHNRVCAYCSSLFCEPLMQCLLGAAPSTPHIADDDGPFPGDRITRSRLLEQWLHRDLISTLEAHMACRAHGPTSSTLGFPARGSSIQHSRAQDMRVREARRCNATRMESRWREVLYELSCAHQSLACTPRTCTYHGYEHSVCHFSMSSSLHGTG